MALTDALDAIDSLELDATKLRPLEERYGVSLNHESLKDTFAFVITIDKDPSGDVDRLGTSRLGGEPDLPQGMEFPEGLYFFGQINFAEVAPHDRSGDLPRAGIMYLFADETIVEDYKVLFAPDDVDLVRTPYPDDFDFADYMDHLKKPTALRFSPNFVFDFYRIVHDSSGLGNLYEALPEGALQAIFATIDKGAYRPLEDFHGSRFFASASDFQSMSFGDPFDPFVAEDLFGEEDEDDEEEEDRDEGGKSIRYLLQIDMDDGHLFVGVPWEDMRRGELDYGKLHFIGT